MAKASSNDILGLGKSLGSGPGAIRQFWNPIKPERGPAAACLKPAPTTFWAWGSLWDRDRGPSVSFEVPYNQRGGQPQHRESQLERHFGPSVLKSHKTREGASRTSVLKPHKTSQGASRSMAKASSNDILGLGKPLRSGQGAIRQFWNPVKPERGPAAASLKLAPTTFWAWGSLRDRDRGPSVSFEIHKTREGASRTSVLKPKKTSQGASRSIAKASSNDILGLGKPLRSGRGPSVSFEIP